MFCDYAHIPKWCEVYIHIYTNTRIFTDTHTHTGTCNPMPGWNVTWNPSSGGGCTLNPMYNQPGLGYGASYVSHLFTIVCMHFDPTVQRMHVCGLCVCQPEHVYRRSLHQEPMGLWCKLRYAYMWMRMWMRMRTWMWMCLTSLSWLRVCVTSYMYVCSCFISTGMYFLFFWDGCMYVLCLIFMEVWPHTEAHTKNK